MTYTKVTNTTSHPNVVTSLVDFLTAYKKLWRLCVIGEESDSKNPKLYYFWTSLDFRSPLYW